MCDYMGRCSFKIYVCPECGTRLAEPKCTHPQKTCSLNEIVKERNAKKWVR